MFLFGLISYWNRFKKQQPISWFVLLFVYIQSFIMWLRKKEFRTFSNTLFFNKKLARQPWINERSIEYPWVYQQIIEITQCKVLDVGATKGLPSTNMLLNNNNEVHVIDINAITGKDTGSNIIFTKGDIRNTNYENNYFDAVVAVSTLEHIGINGRYGIIDSDDLGDFEAIHEVYRILKPDGKVIITVPYGAGRSLPLNRLYDSKRIEALFTNFKLIKRQYFRYNTSYNLWLEVSEKTASQNNWDIEPWYSLGCFVATKN